MEAKHTPGPWKARAMGGHSIVLAQAQPAQNRRNPVAYGYDPKNGYSIALPFTYEERDGKQITRGDFVEFSHDDARLIAAAPDMLAALKDLLAVDEADVIDSKRIETAQAGARAAIRKAEGTDK